MYDLVETPLEASRDVFLHEAFPSLSCDSVLPNPLDRSYTSTLCSQHSPISKYYIEAPIDNSMICDATMDLGYENNMFSMLGVSVDDYVSLGYFKGYDPSIDPLLCMPRELA